MKYILSNVTRNYIIKNINSLPCNEYEVNIKKIDNIRSNQQNKYMWSVMLHDISEQLIIDNKKYSAKVWNEYLKDMFLPHHYIENKTRVGYVKYDELPDGKLILTGSTRDLLTGGFNDYLEKCFAFGAEHGVRFTENRYEHENW